MSQFLLDTNVCIEYLRRRSQAILARIQACRPRDIRLCSIVLAELYHGAYRSPAPQDNLKLVDELADTFVCLPFDELAAERFGEIRTALEKAGTPIGPYDTQIAAIALCANLKLVTHNVNEFSRIASLQIEDWQVQP